MNPADVHILVWHSRFILLQAKVLEEYDAEFDPTAHEEEPGDLPVGISIQNLTKIYESWVSRVDSHQSYW